jgi:hypothetical protein
VAQAAETLAYKHEALSPNPSNAKKTKENIAYSKLGLCGEGRYLGFKKEVVLLTFIWETEGNL